MLSDFQTLVDDLVRDTDNVLDTADRDQAIDRALDRYSQDKPYIQVGDLPGLGTRRLAIPGDWLVGFSQVTAVEYPIGNIPATELDPNQVRIYRSPADTQIELPTSIPSGSSARVAYTIPHTVDVSTDTVPTRHRLGVSALAAAILCGQLASHYAHDSEPTIGADAVDHDSKSDRFRKRARDLENRYFDEVGVSRKRSAAAGVIVDLDRLDSRGGERIFHKGRYR